jgi:hypothetical protein
LEINNNIDEPVGEIVHNAQDPINNDIPMNENDNINDLLVPGIDIQQQQDTEDENVMQLPNNNIGLFTNSSNSCKNRSTSYQSTCVFPSWV